MRKTSLVILTAALLASAQASAGNLTFDGGQTTWHTTQCTKPSPPPSVLGVNPDTQGEELNSLISQHNAYVDAAQAYMNCISNEAERDQTMVNQAITAGAQREIAQTQDEVNRSGQTLRRNP